MSADNKMIYAIKLQIIPTKVYFELEMCEMMWNHFYIYLLEGIIKSKLKNRTSLRRDQR